MRKVLKIFMKPPEMFYETFIDVKSNVWAYVLVATFDIVYLYKVIDMVVP
ncbi:hypothetical protein [Thermosipho melanesiensis]|nr:hypothetical protein [Thermosipho melanesiensis]